MAPDWLIVTVEPTVHVSAPCKRIVRPAAPFSHVICVARLVLVTCSAPAVQRLARGGALGRVERTGALVAMGTVATLLVHVAMRVPRPHATTGTLPSVWEGWLDAAYSAGLVCALVSLRRATARA